MSSAAGSPATFFERLRRVPLWKQLLFLLGWGLLAPFLAFAGGLIAVAAFDIPDGKASYLGVAVFAAVALLFVAAVRKKLGYA